jgi:hypothetical protein
MSKLTVIFLLFVTIAVNTNAQDTTLISGPTLDKFSAGIGGGYEFGGIGGNAIFYPTRGLGIFGGAGYNLAGFGYNAGIKLRITPDNYASEIMPFIIAMYGYNAALDVKYDTRYNKTFYGLTVGGGIDWRPGNSKFGFLSITVYVPIRTTEVKDYIYNLNYFYGIPYSNKLFPLSASIGYKIVFK